MAVFALGIARSRLHGTTRVPYRFSITTFIDMEEAMR